MEFTARYIYDFGPPQLTGLCSFSQLEQPFPIVKLVQHALSCGMGRISENRRLALHLCYTTQELIVVNIPTIVNYT